MDTIQANLSELQSLFRQAEEAIQAKITFIDTLVNQVEQIAQETFELIDQEQRQFMQRRVMIETAIRTAQTLADEDRQQREAEQFVNRLVSHYQERRRQSPVRRRVAIVRVHPYRRQ